MTKAEGHIKRFSKENFSGHPGNNTVLKLQWFTMLKMGRRGRERIEEMLLPLAFEISLAGLLMKLLVQY